MIIVAGTVRIDPENKDAYLDAAKVMIEATRAEAGCITYSFAFDVADKGLVRVFEEWESRAHLEAHFQVDHMGQWRAALAKIGILSKDLKIYESPGGEAL